MNKLFVAMDGDSAGSQVGQAVLMDDVAQLHAISKRIDAGLEAAKNWVLQRGGTVISAGGDEMTAMLDSRFQGEVEQLREAFTKASQLTCTVGHGLTLSQAGKSLLAGKLSGKNQSLQYTRDVEQILGQAHSHDDSDEAHKINEHYLNDTMGDGDEWSHHEGEEHAEMPEGQPEMGDEMQLEMDPTQDVMQDPAMGEDQALDMESGAEHHYAASDHADAEGADPAISDEEKTQAQVDSVLQTMGDGEDSEEGSVELPENPNFVDANAEEQQTEQADKGNDDDLAMADDAAMPPEGHSEFEALQQMLESSATPDEMREKVAGVLDMFSQNKEIIEQMREGAPEAYQSVIAMLQSMIAMAKQLSPQDQPMDPAEDMSAEQQPMAPGEELPKV